MVPKTILVNAKLTGGDNFYLYLFQGALDVLLPMVATVETFPVVFKLLATLRMIIDGQTQVALKVSKPQK